MMLAVSVPKLRGPSVRAAEVRPRRVEAWLSDLPRANVHDSAQQVHQALFAQNRIPLEPGNRLNLMELYQETAATVVDALTKDYALTAFPLSQRNKELVSLVNRLLGEMANGYKIVANDLVQQGRTDAAQNQLVMAIQRSVHYLGRLLLNAYQSYSAYPSGVWNELHKLYRYAESHSLQDIAVSNGRDEADDDEAVGSIAVSYQQICLVGAVNPYSMLQGECARFYNLIPLWQSTAEVSALTSSRDPAGRFLINLNSDAPPIPLIKASVGEEREDLRVLNAIDVVREVHSVLKGLEKGATQRALRSSSIPGVDAAQSDLLRRIGRMLGGVNVRRRSTRSPTDEATQVCVGINSIHYFASGELPFQVFCRTGQDGAAAPGADDVAQNVEEKAYLDLGNPDLNPDGAQQWLPIPDSRQQDDWRFGSAFRRFDCRIADESASGLCIQVQAPHELKVRVGDPIGLQYPTPDRWRVGVVRWLRSRNRGRQEMGIQMLAPEIRAVALRVLTSADAAKAGPEFQALLLPANLHLKQPESLLVPRGTYHSGQRLVLVEPSAGPRLVSPLRTLDRTGSFELLLLNLPTTH